jgi:hypothetical protein
MPKSAACSASQTSPGVERVLDTPRKVDRVVAEIGLEPFALEAPNTVLPGYGPVKVQRELHDSGKGLFCCCCCGVMNDERVGVAVAGMCDQCDGHPSVGGDLFDSTYEVRQSSYGNADVLEEQSATAFECRQCHAPGGDERLALIGGVVHELEH